MTTSPGESSPAATQGPEWEPSRPVLVVEDESALRELITRTLGFAGFDVVSAGDLATAREVVAAGPVAVAVLDVTLPDGSGFDLAQAIRVEHTGVGVLFLTARDSLEDRLTGFAFGADDYLTKPFSVAELLARVGALHRRVAPAPQQPSAPGGSVPSALKVRDVVLDDAAHTVTRAGRPVDLSPTEYKLLRYLLVNVDLVVSKEQILGQVWNYDFVGDVAVVEKFVSQLRRKLDAAGDGLVETVRGFGYTVRSGG